MNRFFSDIKNGILMLTLISIIGISIIITYMSYKSQEEVYEQETLSRLQAISMTLASQINGDELAHLYDHYPEKDGISTNFQDSVYQKIHEKLRMSAEINGLTTPIYTLIYNEEGEKFQFGVTSSDSPFWMHDFRKYPEELLENYKTSGVVKCYQSENGTWLSAFCAIKKSDHTTPIGVVQVDVEFDQFIQKARNGLFSNILITLLIVGTIAILIYFSITTLLKQQEELQQTEKELAIYRKELIANVSHDLRTPLASIQGYVETLLMPELELSEEDRKKYLGITLNSAQNLKRLVDELFELSRLESKDRKLKLQSFCIGELGHDILQGLKLNAKKAGVELRDEINPKIKAVQGDLALIERVLQNLLSNAIKYIPVGSWVKLAAHDHDTHVLVEVIDNGLGIPEDQIPELFDRVYTGKNVKSGTGLGLAIVRGILDLHGSTYKAMNNDFGGVTISFTLPTQEFVESSS